MARPIRHNAEYFYHPASLRNDRRVKAIRARLSLAGYALLVMLLEVLTDADDTRLDTDEMEMELLAGDLGVSVTEIDSLLQKKWAFLPAPKLAYCIAHSSMSGWLPCSKSVTAPEMLH
jgi:hypothetical protein